MSATTTTEENTSSLNAVAAKPQSKIIYCYKEKWETDVILKTWISRDPKDSERVTCAFCNSTTRAHKHDLMEHTKTAKHRRNYRYRCSPNEYANFIQNMEKTWGISVNRKKRSVTARKNEENNEEAGKGDHVMKNPMDQTSVETSSSAVNNFANASSNVSLSTFPSVYYYGTPLLVPGTHGVSFEESNVPSNMLTLAPISNIDMNEPIQNLAIPPTSECIPEPNNSVDMSQAVPSEGLPSSNDLPAEIISPDLSEAVMEAVCSALTDETYGIFNTTEPVSIEGSEQDRPLDRISITSDEILSPTSLITVSDSILTNLSTETCYQAGVSEQGMSDSISVSSDDFLNPTSLDAVLHSISTTNLNTESYNFSANDVINAIHAGIFSDLELSAINIAAQLELEK